MSDVFDEIRAACARVAQAARQVHIDPDGLARLADELAAETAPPDSPDPAQRAAGDVATTVAYGITMNAVNFGSGWFPHLRKRSGRSGYLTLAGALRDRFDREGPLSAKDLCALDAADCAALFEQDLDVPERAELMDLYARALRDLGSWLEERHEGRFERAVAAARGSAARLVASLTEMPLYRDVSRYRIDASAGSAGEEIAVPFYKRAQITASDLARSLEGHELGRFDDLDRLTLFADNLVPHVLRFAGALQVTPGLAAHIESGELLAHGAPEEVELRAVALCAVEALVTALADRGVSTNAAGLDHRLWARGQRSEVKARRRHRTRCPYY